MKFEYYLLQLKLFQMRPITIFYGKPFFRFFKKTHRTLQWKTLYLPSMSNKHDFFLRPKTMWNVNWWINSCENEPEDNLGREILAHGRRLGSGRLKFDIPGQGIGQRLASWRFRRRTSGNDRSFLDLLMARDTGTGHQRFRFFRHLSHSTTLLFRFLFLFLFFHFLDVNGRLFGLFPFASLSKTIPSIHCYYLSSCFSFLLVKRLTSAFCTSSAATSSVLFPLPVCLNKFHLLFQQLN